MEQHLESMIRKSAERLGLDPSHPSIAQAVLVGIAALRDGRDLDESFEFARQVMIQAVSAEAA